MQMISLQFPPYTILGTIPSLFRVQKLEQFQMYDINYAWRWERENRRMVERKLSKIFLRAEEVLPHLVIRQLNEIESLINYFYV